MSPRRAFDHYMVHVGMGTNAKMATLTDGEYRAHISGVLAIAAEAPVRGYLIVGEQAAEPVHVAKVAGVTERVAKTAVEKLKAAGILEFDGELDAWRVHDWVTHNPEPRRDATAAERAKRYRDSKKNGTVTPTVTPAVTAPSRRDDRDGHGPRAYEEVEVEVKPPSPFAVDFEQWALHYERTTGHSLPARTTKAFKSTAESYEARRSEGYSAGDMILATAGAHGDEYRRTNGYDVAESILRPTKIASLIAKGKLRSGNGRQAPKSSLELARDLRGGAA